jgi:pSer/pThr/pTyr-binding forkhead associated (FHA) protein
VITCPKCFKENQDHYKFCLGCGAELPRDVSPKKFAPGTPPHGVPAVKAALPPVVDEVTSIGIPAGPAVAKPAKGPMGTAAIAQAPAAAGPHPAAAPPPAAAPAAPAAAGGPPPITCPQCEHPNPPNNKFCASCGFKLARAAGPAAEPAAVAGAASAAPSGVVLTALRADGTEAGTFALPSGTVTVGRDLGAIFAGDSYLSPRHATFTPRGGKLFVRDEGSLNGVYKKLRRDEPVTLRPGDIFRIGQEIIRYEPLTPAPPTADGVERLGSPAKGYIGRIALMIGRDVAGNAFPLPETGIHLGRERGDVLFPEDGYVSGLHCRIAAAPGGAITITDLGSSNGSFVRIGAETEVQNGDVLLMGQQLFRVTM